MNIALLKNRLAARWRIGLIGAAVSLLAGLICFESETLGFWLRGVSYDLPFARRPKMRPQEAIIVSMDEDSYDKLGQSQTNEWNRALHVELLRQVVALGAQAVVFDILFDRPWPDPAVDRQFAEVIRESGGKVLLAAKLDQGLESKSVISEVKTPTPPLDTVPWGLAHFYLDGDGILRRHYTNAHYTTLSWKTAELLGEAPSDPLRVRWINFYGPRDTIERRSYHEVLLGTNVLPAGFFTDKVVFVGRNPILTPTGVTHEDEQPTPHTRWFSRHKVTGVELQATAFLNLLRRDWLNELPRGVEYAVFIGCGLLFGFGLALMRPWVAVPVGLAGAGVFALGALWLVWEQRFWFPWMIVPAVQMPCALAWAVIAHTKGLAREKETLLREKEDLERKLATSLQAAAAAAAGWHPAERRPTVPDHTLLRCVGRGSYGDVWLARDLVGSFRAVKAVYRDRFTREEPFEREFRGIQSYSPISRTHPGWIDILHVGRNEAESCFFYIMEVGDDAETGQQIDPERYVPRTLDGDLNRQGKLPLEKCVELSLALADALAHLHRHSLIHRDIKPSNVIFVNGVPKFADIGLVTGIRRTGRDVSFLGTEGYMAPEGPGTPMADVFSLGKLIYEASTGRDRRAFPELPTALAEGVTDPAWERLYSIVLKACEYEPRNRYQTASALHEDLLRLQESLLAAESSKLKAQSSREAQSSKPQRDRD